MELTLVKEFSSPGWFDHLAYPEGWFDADLSPDLTSDFTQVDDSGATDSQTFERLLSVIEIPGITDSIEIVKIIAVTELANATDSFSISGDIHFTPVENAGVTDHATIEGPPSGFIGWGIPLH